MIIYSFLNIKWVKRPINGQNKDGAIVEKIKPRYNKIRLLFILLTL